MGAASSRIGGSQLINRATLRRVAGGPRRFGYAIKLRVRLLYGWVRKLRTRSRATALRRRGSGGRRMVGYARPGGSEHDKLSVSAGDGDFITEAAVLEAQRAGEWSLIPGLPDEVAIQCIARVPRAHLCVLRSVSKPWRWAVQTEAFLQLRRQIGCTEDWLYLHVGASPRIPEKGRSRWFSLWQALDPCQYRWHALPPVPYSPLVTGGQVVLGASSVTLNGKLYVIGGAPYGKPAMRDAWVYNPRTNKWRRASSMMTPRFGALVGVIRDKLYVVGGTGICHLTGYSLPCLEVYDPSTNAWKFAASARGIATNYPCNPLKYVAVVENKLCVSGPHSLTGRINSGVYDPEVDKWSEISPGLRMGWGRPSTVMDGNLYTVDLGCYQQYIAEEDVWMSVKAPTSDSMTEWDPRLVSTMAGGNGKLYMVGTMGAALVVVIATVEDGIMRQNVGWHRMKLPNGVDFLEDLGHCSCQVIGF